MKTATVGASPGEMQRLLETAELIAGTARAAAAIVAARQRLGLPTTPKAVNGIADALVEADNTARALLPTI